MIPLKYTIDDKQEITRKDGQKIIDLSSPSIKEDAAVNVLDYFIVRKEEEGRVDKIAMRYYGNIQNTEMLLKFNGISNPFALEEGEILIIGDPVSARKVMISAAVVNRGDIRKQYYQPEKEGKPDPKLKTFEKRKTVKPNKRKDGPALPPNFANPGDKEIEIIGGKIVFGASVSRGGTGTADVPLEKQKFLDNLKNLPAVKNAVKMGEDLSKSSGGTATGTNGAGSNAASGSGKANNDWRLKKQTGAGNDTGVANSKLSPEEEKKIEAQKAAAEKAKNELAKKVNLSKSEVISKLIKQLYKF